MQLIDTHVHLNFEVFQEDFASVRSRWQEVGVVHLVHSCVSPSEFSSIQAIAARVPELSFAIGLHPLDAQEWTADTAEEIRRNALADSKVVAIGEMGLDFYKADNYEQQLLVFEAQLEIATDLNLPIIIHCRDAAAQVKEVLQRWKNLKGDRLRGVMHCWGGTPEEIQWFVDLGFYISFSGTVTFKNALDIQSSCKIVSRERLLIETDCPFLAPVPKRGTKRNEPSFVRYVAEHVAALRGEPIEAIAAQTTQNACQLFGLTL